MIFSEILLYEQSILAYSTAEHNSYLSYLLLRHIMLIKCKLCKILVNVLLSDYVFYSYGVNFKVKWVDKVRRIINCRV